ncbi:MAG: ABC transporter substrate-binding protein [Chitinophagaceae bacterium]|nr:ABC transporter substrate-binding protein [Chitinophagaceae bacterium]MBL0337125.1 ABC transporter substrate-binding protein [Chitinophagaceae bacterium]
MLQTGILLPRSTLFPSIGIDILNGIRNAWELQGVSGDISVKLDNIGFGIDEDEIYRLTEKLVLQDNLDLVIVCGDIRIEELLRPLFTASGKILLMVNMGANTPESWQKAPTTINHSLNFCIQALLTSGLAVQDEDKRAAYTASYYDAGYRQIFHMMNGHQIQGGVPVYTHVTHLKNENFTIQPLEDLLNQDASLKKLCCLFCADQAQLFYNHIRNLTAKDRLQLYVTPMMLEESLLASLETDIYPLSVQGYIPWHASLENESNKQFTESMQQHNSKAPDYFSLLGWEAGHITGYISKLHKEGNRNATALVKACTEYTFSSPRGWLKIDPETHFSYAPARLARVIENNKLEIGPDNNDTLAALDVMKQPSNSPGEATGWRNTYLCI